MKRIIFVLALILFAVNARSQTVTHSNVITWIASPSTGVTGYNVYRFSGACSLTAVFTKLTTAPITVLTFIDTGMLDGAVNCYYVAAVGAGGLESTGSGTIECRTPTFTADAHPLPPGRPVGSVR